MNQKRSPILPLATLLACGILAQNTQAVDGKWNIDAAGNWSTASNWTNNQIADGVGAVANISFNITAARTLTLDGPRTVGKLRFEDATTSSHDWTFSASGSGVLTLQAASGSPTIEPANRTTTINTPLAGTQGFTKLSSQILALNSTNTGLTGKIILSAGDLRLKTCQGLGADPGTYVADQITINGAALMNNDSELAIAPNYGITLGSSGGNLQAGWGKPYQINAPIAGSGTLTIRNDATPGLISLNAPNTYTNATFVGNSAATTSWAWLLVNNTLASSSVQVRTNASLGGTGPINGPVSTTTNALISPGGVFQAGTLVCTNKVSLTNAILNFDLADETTPGGTANDLLQVGGDLTLQGIITVAVNPLKGTLAAGTYRLINYAGTLNLANAAFVCSNPRLGATFDSGTPGQINMTIANPSGANLVWVGSAGTNWDIAVTTNFLNNGSPDVFYQGDSVTFDDSGSYTNAAGIALAAPSTAMATLQPVSVTVNTTNNVTIAAAGSPARLGGAMNLYKGGPGTLLFQHANNNQPNIYMGLTVVTNGILRLGNFRVLGSTNADSGTIVTNLGQFDFNGQGSIAEPIVLQGSGPDGSGAIYNSGAGLVNNGFLSTVTLAGDATFGGPNRWDVYGGRLFGNGHKLTKTGASEIALSNLGDTGLGELEINQGTLTFLGTTWPGLADSPISVISNATLNFWAMNNTPDTRFNKAVALTNSSIRLGTGTNYLSGTVTLEGTNAFNANGSGMLSFAGPVVGPGALQKTGNYLVSLEGTNTYAGPTLVSSGTLILGTNATLSGTPLIALTSGTTLDVSQMPAGLTLAGSQTLAGGATVQGSLATQPGATLMPGSPIGTLTLNGDLGLNNATMVFDLGGNAFSGNDFISAYSAALSGVTTIKIVPQAALDTANPYTLMQLTANMMPSGSEANFAVTSDTRYGFTLLPTDASSGLMLQVQVSGTASPASLTWAGNDATHPTWWDTKVTANWANGASPDVFYGADSVVFDDTATGTSVDLVGTIQPVLVTLAANSKPFAFGGAGTLQASALTANGAAATTFANPDGNGFLFGVTNNQGALTFNNGGVNNFGSGLTLNNGTVTLANGAGNSFGSAIINGGTLLVNNNGVNAFGSALNINNNANVRFQNLFNNTATIINFGGGTLTFDQAFPATSGSAMSGSGLLVKEGTNTLTLSAASGSFGGNIEVHKGTLRAANAAALGGVTGSTTIANGAALDVNGQTLGFEPVFAIGAGPDGLGAIVNRGAAQQNALRNVTLTGNATFGALTNRWDIRSDNVAQPNANLVSGGNPYTLTKVGPLETWIVSTYVDPALGNIELMQGTLGYENQTTSFGDPSYTLTVYSNATLGMYNSVNPMDKRILIKDGGRVAVSSGAGNAIVGTIDIPSGLGTFDVSSGVTLTLSNTISGDGSLLKQNTGTLFLNGTNTITGNITNYNGTLVVSNSLALGSNKLVTVNFNTGVAGGAGTRLGLRGGFVPPADVTAIFNATTNGGDFRCSLGSESMSNTWQGAILLGGNNIVGFYASPANQLTILGPIYGTNGYTGTAFFRGAAGVCGWVRNVLNAPTGIMNITDNAVWQFDSPSNQWARTAISFGRMILGTNNAACPTAELVLGQSGSSSGTLDLNGFTQTVPSVITVNSNWHFIGSSSTTADSHFIFDGGANVSLLDGHIVDSVSGGTRKLAVTVKSGSLTLLNTNSYTGVTTLSGGKLGLGALGTLLSPLVDLRAGATLDTAAKTAGLVLGAGQTLKGDGMVNGSITFASGSTLTPGAPVGTLTVNNVLTLQAGSTNLFDLNKGATPAQDSVTAASVVYGGILSLNNLGPALVAGDSFKLFTANSYSGSFAELVPATPGSNLLWDTSRLTVDGTLAVKSAVVSTPTNLGYSLSGSTLTLSWPSDYTGWRLEAQTNSIGVGLSTNWFTVPGSTITNQMSFTIDPAQPTVFYRLGFTP